MSQSEAGELLESQPPVADDGQDDGWTRRFTAFGNRLNEAIELYCAIGFEIKLEPAVPDPEQVVDTSACAQCFMIELSRTIYTRPLANHAGEATGER